MPTKKPTRNKSSTSTTKPGGKKLTSRKTGRKVTKARKSGKKRASSGILTRAKETLKQVFTSAAAGAAQGAVAGAADAGQKVMGAAEKTNVAASKADTRKASKK